MIRSRFQHILEHPEDIEAHDMEQLEALSKQYPWFSHPKVLLAKALSDKDDHRAQDWIKKAAAQTFDRSTLKRFLEETSFIEALKEKDAEIVALVAQDALAMEKDVPSILQEEDAPPSENQEPTAVSTQELETEENSASASAPSEPSPVEADEIKPERVAPVLSPLDEEILVTAISTTIGLEADEWAHEQTADNDEEGQKSETKDQSTFSYAQWLRKRAKALSYPTDFEEVKLDEESQEETPLDKAGLIDRFIKNQPQIARLRDVGDKTPLMPVIAKDDTTLVTETLAEIYAQQGHMKKAIKAYETLRLAYPEKSVYFATRIKKLKERDK